MDDWKQVVSDSQAYKQFGNAVTTTVFTAIAEEIAKSIYAAEESEEQNMEAENKNFTGMNEPEEKPTAESILAAAEAEAKTAAGREVRGSRNGKVDERGVGKLPIQNIHIQKHQYREQHNIA